MEISLWDESYDKHHWWFAQFFSLVLGAVCFLKGKTSAVFGPHLQISVEEEVDKISAVCKTNAVCFFNVCRLLK
ncbi:hypothetical protein Hanom_Chr12g01159951 [Helianthus anomalus]